jgi:Concanavalin A-like lectin/glucanases superfamily/Secretion system C-terminal sorting domain
MKLIPLSLFVCLISFGSFAQGSDHLIAHWNFNGSANDVSGHGLNGVVSGATSVAGYSGIANTAYYFNGTGDHIDVPYDSLMNIDSTFSICTFIKPLGFYSGLAQGNFILARGEEATADYYQIGYCDNAYDSSDFVFSPNNEVFYSSVIGLDETSWYPGNTLVDSDTWYCVAIVYTGDTVNLYINGAKIRSLATHKVFAPGTDGIGIGYYPAMTPDYPYWINAILDDIRLYGRSLSDTEVAQYCDSVKMIPPSATASIVKDQDVIIYPNPAHNRVIVQMPDNFMDNRIELVNSVGEVVAEMRPSKNIVELNISALPVGIYFAKISCDERTVIKRIVKD